MKKLIRFGCVVLLAVVAARLSAVDEGEVSAELHPLKAFQVVSHLTSANNVSYSQFYRRSNGDTVTYLLDNDTKEYNRASQGILIVTAPAKGRKMTFGSGKSRLGVERDFNEGCTAFSDLRVPVETKTILGLQTLHAARTRSSRSRAGQSVEDRTSQWLAPSLNCFVLEERIEEYVDGQLYAWQETTATKAVIGDPPDEVFKVPRGLIEAPPDVFFPMVGGHFRPQQVDAYYRDKAAREAFRLPF